MATEDGAPPLYSPRILCVGTSSRCPGVEQHPHRPLTTCIAESIGRQSALMSQPLLRTFWHGTLSLGLLLLSMGAGAAADAPDAAVDEAALRLRQTAMPDMGGDRLGMILNRFYNEGMGGPKNWEQVVSLRVSGQLTLDGGAYDFSASTKKPNYLKMTIHGHRRTMQMGYDGNVAWQQLGPIDPIEMEPAQARRFIHGAHFGNQLLYPYALGKQVEYLDTVPVDGTICHQLRVTLDTGYQLDYFIDIRSYHESKVITTDRHTSKVHVSLYQDYFRESGIPLARKVVSSENGVWVSTLVLDTVKVNPGVMTWMFKMPE